jgi:hypothetical protein
MKTVTLREIANYLYNNKGIRCNCDLDNWQPENDTGHSWVCRIHKSAKSATIELKNEVINSLHQPNV